MIRQAADQSQIEYLKTFLSTDEQDTEEEIRLRKENDNKMFELMTKERDERNQENIKTQMQIKLGELIGSSEEP